MSIGAQKHIHSEIQKLLSFALRGFDPQEGQHLGMRANKADELDCCYPRIAFAEEAVLDKVVDTALHPIQ